jgi:hypothetical protein
MLPRHVQRGTEGCRILLAVLGQGQRLMTPKKLDGVSGIRITELDATPCVLRRFFSRFASRRLLTSRYSARSTRSAIACLRTKRSCV